MINPATDSELLDSVLNDAVDLNTFVNDNKVNDPEPVAIPQLDPYNSERSDKDVKSIQTDLFVRVTLVERQLNEALARLLVRETVVDERMNGILRRVETIGKSVEACLMQVTSFKSFSNLVTIGTSTLAAVLINVLRHFFQ